MFNSDQFVIGIQAIQELREELLDQKRPHPPSKGSESNPISSGPEADFPGGFLLLGLAEDGLPVLLDMYNPAPGPLLVVGDRGSGKTALLQSLARVTGMQDPGDIQFGVLTQFLEEWKDIENQPESLGIWPAGHPSSEVFLSLLVKQADGLQKTRQVILFLVDGLDLISSASIQAQRDLRWLLADGPKHQIYPVVTINSSRALRLYRWQNYFSTHILGLMKDSQNAPILAGVPPMDPSILKPGVQFAISQPGKWLKFVLPPLN